MPSGPPLLCCPARCRGSSPSIPLGEGQGPLTYSHDLKTRPLDIDVKRGKTGRASPWHPCDLTVEQWQGQLSLILALEAGSPVLPALRVSSVMLSRRDAELMLPSTAVQ